MRLGIMSFAHMHSYGYAAAISQLPGVELAGVADEEPDRGKQAAEQLNTRYFPSFDELFKADLDGVIIADNRSQGPDRDGCAAGKHILCEKPIATTEMPMPWRKPRGRHQVQMYPAAIRLCSG